MWSACAPQIVPSSLATTDDDAVLVDIGSAVWPEGQATLPIRVTEAVDETPVIDASVSVVTAMSDMPHDNTPVIAIPLGDGVYSADVWFSMQGLWALEVSVARGSNPTPATASLWVSVE